ncbi:hypothetical protein FRC01_011924, partial [Tulasnella sp. 417]
MTASPPFSPRPTQLVTGGDVPSFGQRLPSSLEPTVREESWTRSFVSTAIKVADVECGEERDLHPGGAWAGPSYLSNPPTSDAVRMGEEEIQTETVSSTSPARPSGREDEPQTDPLLRRAN